MKVAGAVIATVLALALQTTLARLIIRGTVAVDLVVVVVLYVALRSGPAVGLLTGTFAGLVQDALSSGVIGIGGLAKTIVGYGVGVIGRQFIVAEPLPRLVVFFVGIDRPLCDIHGSLRAARLEAIRCPVHGHPRPGGGQLRRRFGGVPDGGVPPGSRRAPPGNARAGAALIMRRWKAARRNDRIAREEQTDVTG